MTTNQRPNIDEIQSAQELKRWYWLKEELIGYCKTHGIPYGASKFELLDRIVQYLETGKIPKPRRKNITSKFDWASSELTRETFVTDNYRNTQNMRRFMTKQIGAHFKFNIAFMEWMQSNTGKKLSDAIDAWNSLEAKRRVNEFSTDIKEHNQFNQYLRDFFEDNPQYSIREAHICWQYKRSLPTDSGRHQYSPDDLQALQDGI